MLTGFGKNHIPAAPKIASAPKMLGPRNLGAMLSASDSK